MDSGKKKTGRGRPPKYDRSEALGRAVDAFWARGFSATTLDDLVESTGMNRPSLYNAFGDKESMYLLALEHFLGELRAVLAIRVMAEPDLGRALANLYSDALDSYFSNDPALGCFVFCTAPVEVPAHPPVRDIARRVLDELDELLAQRFRDAQQQARWSPRRDPRVAARLAQATLHSLAIRARVGESRASLNRMARNAVDWLVED